MGLMRVVQVSIAILCEYRQGIVNLPLSDGRNVHRRIVASQALMKQGILVKIAISYGPGAWVLVGGIEN